MADDRPLLHMDSGLSGASGLSEFDVEVAALYVQDAVSMRLTGWDRRRQRPLWQPSPWAVKWHKWRFSQRVENMMSVVVYFNLAVALIETPSSYAVPWLAFVFEGLCLCVYIAEFRLRYRIADPARFWTVGWNRVQFAAIAVGVVAQILEPLAGLYLVVRAFRVCHLIYVNPVLRIAVSQLIGVIRGASTTLAIMTFSLLYADILFSLVLDATVWDDHFIENLWQLYVAMTTANFPDVMMPAYHQNWFMSIAFAAFMTVQFFMFMNVLLAVISSTYDELIAGVVKHKVQVRREMMVAAFELLTGGGGHGRAHLDVGLWEEVVRLQPGCAELSAERMALLKALVGPRDRGFLTCDEFMDTTAVLLTPIDDRHDFPPPPPPPKPELAWVEHHGVSVVLYLLIVVQVAATLATAEHCFRNSIAFTILYSIEAVLRIRVRGWDAYIRDRWHKLDLVCVAASWLYTASCLGHIEDDGSQIFFLVRSMRLLRIVPALSGFRVMANCFVRLLPKMVSWLQLLLCLFYAYAVIGMALLADTVSDTDWDSGENADTAFANSPYYELNNFDDIGNSFVTLFELLVVNQWHIITDGHVTATGVTYVRYFFILFNILGVLFVGNIVIAIFIEGYNSVSSKAAADDNPSPLETRLRSLQEKGQVDSRWVVAEDSFFGRVLDSLGYNPINDDANQGLPSGSSGLAVELVEGMRTAVTAHCQLSGVLLFRNDAATARYRERVGGELAPLADIVLGMSGAFRADARHPPTRKNVVLLAPDGSRRCFKVRQHVQAADAGQRLVVSVAMDSTAEIAVREQLRSAAAHVAVLQAQLREAGVEPAPVPTLPPAAVLRASSMEGDGDGDGAADDSGAQVMDEERESEDGPLTRDTSMRFDSEDFDLSGSGAGSSWMPGSSWM